MERAVVFRVRGMIGTLCFRKVCKRLAHRNRRAWACFACAKHRGVVHERSVSGLLPYPSVGSSVDTANYPKTAGGWFGGHQVRVREIIERVGCFVAFDWAAQLPPLWLTEELGESVTVHQCALSQKSFCDASAICMVDMD